MNPVTSATRDANALLVANVLELVGAFTTELTLEDGEAMAIVSANTRIPEAELEAMLAGELYPCPRELARLATALGTTIDHLLSEDPQPHA